ncbi:stalk domain-containing protein [Paenibacillus sp. L3-i20]|uniref:stalk domain-containing protein n=1 Tax=Paenibacillus sp. L3-i20 TaxID=2905833 RepID=UPI001EDDD3DC|nr:stalk domain-containing protein [Paenibacillus sp. L3-i20]GKU80166.1 hypothetical protein L3i20_v245630 [Paenibacillus sp. L3-i20]
MKKSFSIVLSFLLLFVLMPTTLSAETAYSVYVDGVNAKATVAIKNKVYYVEPKAIFTTSGYTYTYDMKTKSYVVQKGKEAKISFKLNDKSYLVNGIKNQIQTPALTIQKKTMISTEFFAKITGKAQKISSADKIISFGDYNPSELGNIKGAITWQYNEYVGTKPDVGANVTLIPTVVNKIVNDTFFALTLKQVDQGTNGIYTTLVDGNGDYNIDDVPAGKYFLLISSNNTNSDLTVEKDDMDTLSQIFDKETMEMLELNLKLEKYELKTITIKKDKTITESHDFGYTYF